MMDAIDDLGTLRLQESAVQAGDGGHEPDAPPAWALQLILLVSDIMSDIFLAQGSGQHAGYAH